MKIRALFLTVAVLGLGMSGASEAAKPKPKPVCNLIQDATGDGGASEVPGNASDDIVSGDVASDGKTITGVVRLAELAQPDPQSPLGRAYMMEFGVKGAESLLFLSARVYPTGTKYIFGYSGVDPNTGVNTSYTLGDATGVVDVAKKEVRISAPNASFAPAGSKLPKGAKLLAPTAKTMRVFGQGVVPSQQVGPARAPLGGLTLQFDDGSGLGYTVGALSCVKPGT